MYLKQYIALFLLCLHGYGFAELVTIENKCVSFSFDTKSGGLSAFNNVETGEDLIDDAFSTLASASPLWTITFADDEGAFTYDSRGREITPTVTQHGDDQSLQVCTLH